MTFLNKAIPSMMPMQTSFTTVSFVRTVSSKKSNLISTGPEDSLASYVLAFAAERACRKNCVFPIDNIM